MNIWQTMEMIHSRSYTHIIKNVYPDPSVVFDHILDDEKILSRAQSVTRAYDDFINLAQTWGQGNMWKEDWKSSPTAEWELKDLKRKLYRAVANVYILEGIRFYVSFACSFAFGELKLLEGSAKIIGLIARDESQHMTVTQNILNNWVKGDDPDMVQIAKEEEENVYKMFRECVEEEKTWAEYLFKDGSIIGLNDKLLQKYVEWTANRRLKSIGLKAIFDTPISNNPLPWTQHWLSSKGMQVAPQETEVESYLIGSIKQDVKKDTFAGFQLKFEHHWGGERTTIQKIKGWIKKQKPPFDVILMHLFSYVELWYWEGKLKQTMATVDMEVEKIHELWDKEHDITRNTTMEVRPSEVPHLDTLIIRNNIVERGTEESGTSVETTSTSIEIPDPWDER